MVEELSHAELTYGERMRVGEVNARWLKAKAGFGGELQLMTHPFDVEDEVSWVGRSIDWEGRKERCMRACVPRLLARSLQDHHHPENTLGRSIHWWYVCLGWLARPTANTHHPSPNPPTNNAQWQVRKFYCFDRPRSHPESVLLAFIFFTPCFRGGRTVGYNANILRRDPTLERPNYGGWVDGCFFDSVCVLFLKMLGMDGSIDRDRCRCRTDDAWFACLLGCWFAVVGSFVVFCLGGEVVD